MEVDDIRTYLDKAVRLGATVLIQPLRMEFDGSKFSIAAFKDPKGNFIGLVHDG